MVIIYYNLEFNWYIIYLCFLAKKTTTKAQSKTVIAPKKAPSKIAEQDCVDYEVEVQESSGSSASDEDEFAFDKIPKSQKANAKFLAMVQPR
jgi:hypothetical protein